MLEKAHELLDFRGYEDLYENYGNLAKISFDYAVVEKEKSIGVLELPAGCKHKVTAKSRMIIMDVQIGEAISKENKIKWNRV